MQSKSIVAIAVVLLTVISLSVTGCMSSTSTTQDAVLEKMVNASNVITRNTNVTVLSYNITWLNNTAVNQDFTYKIKNYTQFASQARNLFKRTFSPNAIFSSKITFLRFTSTDAATAFLNAHINNNYSLTSAHYVNGSDVIYETATGHAPTTYASYYSPAVTVNGVWQPVLTVTQEDDIVSMANDTILAT